MKNSLRIPRIIHQTWKTKDVPSPLDQLPQTWKEYLPNWEYILWTDEMNRNLSANISLISWRSMIHILVTYKEQTLYAIFS